MLSALITTGIAALSSYTGYLSYQAITRLQKYESSSEKAAKVSDKARHELDTTRSTHTQAALTILLSLLTSLYLLLTKSHTGLTIYFIYVALSGILYLGQSRMGQFWQPKEPPAMFTPEGYREAVLKSKDVSAWMRVLGIIWAGKVGLGVLGLG